MKEELFYLILATKIWLLLSLVDFGIVMIVNKPFRARGLRWVLLLPAIIILIFFKFIGTLYGIGTMKYSKEKGLVYTNTKNNE